RGINHVEVGGRGDQSCRARLQIDDQADPAAEPLLRALEVVLASRKPNQPRTPKGMPGQDGVAMKRTGIAVVYGVFQLRTRELELLNAVHRVCANFAAELKGHRPVGRSRHTVIHFAQQNQVGKPQDGMSVERVDYAVKPLAALYVPCRHPQKRIQPWSYGLPK